MRLVLWKNGNKFEIIYDTITDQMSGRFNEAEYDCVYDESKSWVCEKEFKKEDEEVNPFVQDTCNLTGTLRG